MQACRLAVHDIACRRGDRILFRGLSFALEAGAALHVAGPNGVGKSSLIRMLAGLLRPFAGRVEQQGSLALLDERSALDPHLPLGHALRLWERIDRATAEPAVRQLGIDALCDVPVRYLSTGQKKRAGLARLLSQKAAIWLLDEPLNGLDAEAARLVETLVAQHCEQGGIAVIASHQPLSQGRLDRLQLDDHAA